MMQVSTTTRFLRLLVRRQAPLGCLQNSTQTQAPRLAKALRKQQTFGEGGYILLVIPLATFCLGTWQVKRRFWKLALIESLEEKTQSAPVPLPLNLEEVGRLEYRQVTFCGEFDHSREMLVGPRSNVLKEGGGLVSAGNLTGACVVTPFKLSGREETILVNRGWVPSTQLDVRTRQEGQVQGEVEVAGIVRLQEQRSPFMPVSDRSNRGLWLYRDVQSMAQQAGTAPVFVDLNVDSSVAGGPIGGQTRVTLRNEHLSYIITWYSLSLITFVMWYRRYRRPLPPGSAIEFLNKQSKQ